MTKKKKIAFYNDFEEQRIERMRAIYRMTFAERQQYYSLHSSMEEKPLSKKMEIFTSFPGETVEDFYKRINSEQNPEKPS